MAALDRLGVFTVGGRRRRLSVTDPWASYQELQVLGDPFEPDTDWNVAGFWQAPFTGAPWRGQNYGATARDLSAGNAPSAGTAVNGYVPASFNGTTNYLTSSAIEDFVTAGFDFSSFVVFKAVGGSLPADSTPVYDCPQIWSNAAGNAGIALSAGGVRFWYYDTIAPLHTTPLAAVSNWSVWHIAVVRTVGATLEISVDGGSWQSDTIGGSYASLGGLPLEVGRNYDATKFLPGELLELGFLTRALSDAEADTYRQYALARYAISSGGIPCLVLLDGLLRQLPSVPPYGLRVVLSSGVLVTSVSGGRSLVLNPDGSIREAATGEAVATP